MIEQGQFACNKQAMMVGKWKVVTGYIKLINKVE